MRNGVKRARPMPEGGVDDDGATASQSVPSKGYMMWARRSESFGLGLGT